MTTLGPLLDLIYDVGGIGHLQDPDWEPDEAFREEFSLRSTEVLFNLALELDERGSGDTEDNFRIFTETYLRALESPRADESIREVKLGELSAEGFKELRLWLRSIHDYFVKYALPEDLM